LIRLWKRKKHSEPKDFLENCTVASLVPGQTAEIFELLSKDKAILQKLASLGLLPGARLKLLRRFPCFLLQTGYAQLALDRRLAMSIAIKPLDEVNPIATYNAKSAA
jgi:Fe2+ transport system protein FeoA